LAELANYIGKNLVHLIDRDEDDAYCFRLHKDRYVIQSLYRLLRKYLKTRTGNLGLRKWNGEEFDMEARRITDIQSLLPPSSYATPSNLSRTIKFNIPRNMFWEILKNG
jgi:hypothetical protein